MINETLQGMTESANFFNVNYEQWTAVTTKPVFILAMICVWILCFLLYLIVGSVVKAGGKYYSKKLVESANYWYAMIFFGLLYWILALLFIIFPVWINLF